MRYIRLESEPLDICWLSETQMAASCADGHVRVIDSQNVNLTQTLLALEGWAYAIAAHPKDGTIAVAGSDGQIRRIQLRK